LPFFSFRKVYLLYRELKCTSQPKNLPVDEYLYSNPARSSPLVYRYPSRAGDCSPGQKITTNAFFHNMVHFLQYINHQGCDRDDVMLFIFHDTYHLLLSAVLTSTPIHIISLCVCVSFRLYRGVVRGFCWSWCFIFVPALTTVQPHYRKGVKIQSRKVL
jgi:hypothetical protein